MTRDDFEEVLGALARSGLIKVVEASFEKDGKSIPFRKAMLTSAGEAIEEGEQLALQMKAEAPAGLKARKGKKAAKGKPSRRVATSAPSAKAKAKAPQGAVTAATAEDRQLEDALRQWRLNEAKKLGVPAVRVITDRTLRAIAGDRPGTAAELLAIPGIGLATVEKYGAQIYRLVQSAGG
jgi:superfamily II DNA helicase RecQ